MHVTVSSTFPGAIRAEIEAIVRAGFDGTDGGDVEAHVKARARVVRWYLAEWVEHGEVVRYRFRRKREAVEAAQRFGGVTWDHQRRHPRAGGWSGRTYNGVPGIARVRPGTGYLVTFNIPADPRRLTRYPSHQRDPRLKTGPIVRFDCWADQLLHLAAHEARHVHQFRHDLPGSELDAERWAAGVLLSRRASLGV